ncbi:2-C-methyl-D-erythritol 4-phosphate cytidylyltransferase [Ruania zhangjianzhongii]|uniref:2-C-methyl-D-erythritol 4-phosphate cytidylyltransferase n=1 Tax=Ruania zhangjianzhongii TaxID=2603206 RepID=UPI0011CA76E8|nr:2-C-methyl-D-erythritol 4-phosphate cytidylyltransferase [Ruania zhangjianzhongii]
MRSAGAVLTAAGSGSRLGAAVPKALVELAGTTLVAHAAARLAGSGRVRHLVVTGPGDQLTEVRAAVRAVCAIPVEVVPGGPTRQASVAAGLAALDASNEIVLVHDAARPLASTALIAQLIDTVASGHDAVVPALPVTDTIKEVDDADPPRAVRTIARERLRAVQTPQAFRASLLRTAHRDAALLAADEHTAVSDDAGLVERLGHEVRVIEGESRALKITTRHDLAIAALFLEEES